LNADDNEIVLLSGCVINPPVFSPNREQFTLQLAPNAAARISVNLKGANLPLEYGRQVEVAAKSVHPGITRTQKPLIMWGISRTSTYTGPARSRLLAISE
jgi:hypothetical protein